jgi:peptidoglycan/xylan/chitin deacetylase (PgdA/CDA1 family)
LRFESQRVKRANPQELHISESHSASVARKPSSNHSCCLDSYATRFLNTNRPDRICCIKPFTTDTICCGRMERSFENNFVESAPEYVEPFVIYGVLTENADNISGSVAVVEWFHWPVGKTSDEVEGNNGVGRPMPFPKGSYAIFDTEWNPLEFHGKKSNMDSAIILYAAQQLKEGNENKLLEFALWDRGQLDSDNVGVKERTVPGEASSAPSNTEFPFMASGSQPSGNRFNVFQSLSNDSSPNCAMRIHRSEILLDTVKSKVQNGELPMVPVKRSSIHQFLIQQSVDWFFHQNTVRFFACQPYRFSPRTIYRFPSTIQPSNAVEVESNQRSPKGYIALTIDDAPCRLDNRESSKLSQVLDLLDRYQATATFMVIQQFLTASHEPDLIRLLRRGHEMANHGVQDAAMSSVKDYPTAEAFGETVRQGNHRIEELQDIAAKDVGGIECDKDNNKIRIQHGVKWFRAPHGKYTKLMEQGLERLDMYNVMCDVYAVDPVVEDGEWIAKSLAQQAKDGSIILIHMPERGFREYCLTALELLLENLCNQQGYHIVTVSELERISKASMTLPESVSTQSQ